MDVVSCDLLSELLLFVRLQVNEHLPNSTESPVVFGKGCKFLKNITNEKSVSDPNHQQELRKNYEMSCVPVTVTYTFYFRSINIVNITVNYKFFIIRDVICGVFLSANPKKS